MDIVDKWQDPLDGWTNLSQGFYLQRTTQTQEKLGQTSIPELGFEITIPVFERAKTYRNIYWRKMTVQ
jgi:hypothetical protein